MSARAEVKPVYLGRDHAEVERIARAIDVTLISYSTLPNSPANEELKARYWRRYQELCGEMLGALYA